MCVCVCVSACARVCVRVCVRVFARARPRVCVPDGLLTDLLLKRSDPSSHQLKCVVSQYFYALDMDKQYRVFQELLSICFFTIFTTIPTRAVIFGPPAAVGIFVVRETITYKGSDYRE